MNQNHKSYDTFNKATDNTRINFNGASIIDESGKEVPITEQMLQQTFRSLIEAWEKAYQERRLK